MDNFVTNERLEEILGRKHMKALLDDIEFSLTLQNVHWPEYCPALGMKLDYFRRGRGKQCDHSPSFDRLDPKKGYTPENVRVISYRANRIKNDASLTELRKVADWLASQTEVDTL